MMTFRDPRPGVSARRDASPPVPAGTPASDLGPAPAVARAGDVPAVSIVDLLDRHGPEIYRHLRRLSPTAEDAADMHQETFLRAYRAWRRLPPDAQHRAWLHRIAANVAVDAHRRRLARGGSTAARADALAPGSHAAGAEGRIALDRSTTATRAEEPVLRVRAGAGTDPVARLEAAELRAAVRSALDGLPPRECIAVTARVLDGAPYADVAAMLDCTDENARQIVSRGLRRLRAALAPHLENDR